MTADTPATSPDPNAAAHRVGGPHPVRRIVPRQRPPGRRDTQRPGQLTGLPEDEWPDRLRRLIVDQAGLILRRAIDPDRSFAEHGLDSLGMLELRTSVETQTGIRISPKTIVSYNTARSLAAHLSESLAAEA